MFRWRHGMEPPKSIYEVDPMRLFGLISTVDVISEIRDSRLGDDYARARRRLLCRA